MAVVPLPPPRWAVVAAHAVALVRVPSTLWRAAMAAGLPVGYGDAVLARDYDLPGRGALVLLAICLVQETLVLATLVLVRPWGLRRSTAIAWSAVAGAVLLTPLAVDHLRRRRGASGLVAPVAGAQQPAQ